MDNYDRFKDPRHIKWAKEVKKRDNYTCRICGAKNVYLNSHHINSYDFFKEQRFCVDNGITMCQNCHNSFHLIFGTGKNTDIQFREFTDMIKLIKDIAEENYDRKSKRSCS